MKLFFREKLTEKELVEGCVKGSRKCHNMLFELLSARMMGVCMRYAPDRDTAEDMLQDGFIKVFAYIGSFGFNGSLEGWVRRIMVNTAIEHYRKSLKFQSSDNLVDSLPAAEEEFIMQKLATEELLRLIQGLPDGYRTIFNLYAIEGYTHREIAEKLGISEGTSKSQLARARKVLQDQLTSLNTIKDEACAR